MPQLDNGSPFTLTSGTLLTLRQPGQAGTYLNQRPPAWVILQNNSQLNLTWKNGQKSGSISPLGGDLILLSTGGINTVTVLPSGTGTGELYVTWSVDGDAVPQNYPTGNTTITDLVIGNVGLEDPNEGGPIPLVATTITRNFFTGTSSTLLAAPVTGQKYLFAVETDGCSATALALDINGMTWIVPANAVAAGPYPLFGIPTGTAVTGLGLNGAMSGNVSIMWAPGP